MFKNIEADLSSFVQLPYTGLVWKRNKYVVTEMVGRFEGKTSRLRDRKMITTLQFKLIHHSRIQKTPPQDTKPKHHPKIQNQGLNLPLLGIHQRDKNFAVKLKSIQFIFTLENSVHSSILLIKDYKPIYTPTNPHIFMTQH